VEESGSITRQRVRFLFAVFWSVRTATGSNTRALRYLARLLTQKSGQAAAQTAAYLAAPRRAAALQALSAKLASGNPSIAVRVTGGIGDYVVIARFLRDLLATAPEAQVDVYCSHPASAAWVFGRLPGLRSYVHDILFDHNLQHYDIAFRISQFVVVHQEMVNWGALLEHPSLVAAIDNIIRFRPNIEVFVKRHPRMDNFLALKAGFSNRTRRDFLHAMAGIDYSSDRLSLSIDRGALGDAGLAGRDYVTIHNGFDENFIISGDSATKCYPHFGSVVSVLRAHFPHLIFVQIGASTSKPIPGVQINLVGRTTLQQSAGLIAQARLHIDNEGGLVHVAAALGVQSCVVFGPTPSAYFAYPDNVTIDPNFCGGCWWITDTWMDVCARGFRQPRCMSELPAEDIAMRLVTHLKRAPAAIAAE